MGGILGCKVNQRLKKCPYNEIKRLESNIEQYKIILAYIEDQIKELEERLYEADKHYILRHNKKYYDWLSWENDASLVGRLVKGTCKESHIISSCPYDPTTCEQVVEIKLSRSRFLKNKMIQRTNYYNEIISLMCKLMHIEAFLYNLPTQYLLIYHGGNYPFITFFDLKALKKQGYGCYLALLLYPNDSSHEVIEEVLDYTYSKGFDEIYKSKFPFPRNTDFIKIEWVDFYNGWVEQKVMSDIQKLIRWINKCSIKNIPPIKGVYIPLTNLRYDRCIRLIKNSKILGYEAIGYIDDKGEYREEQLLVWIQE